VDRAEVLLAVECVPAQAVERAGRAALSVAAVAADVELRLGLAIALLDSSARLALHVHLEVLARFGCTWCPFHVL
jgi:hypothetical protein